LITGADGLIGRALVRKLVQEGRSFTATDIRTNSELGISRLDVTERGPVYDAVKEADVVVHLAALVGGKPSEKFPWQYSYVNYVGTLNVLEAIREIDDRDIKLVFMSSWGTFGTDISLPIDEATPQNPRNPYGVSKVSAEGLVKLYADLYGLNAIVLRPTMIYGPEQMEKTHVQQIVDCMLTGDTFEIWGEGTHTRELLHVDDMADILYKSIDYIPTEPHTVFIVGTENPLSVKEVAKAGQRIAPFDIEYVPSNKWVFSQRSDMSKLVKEMGIDPLEFRTIEEGLKDCLEYRRNL